MEHWTRDYFGVHVAVTVFLVSVTTHTPSGPCSVAVTPVARMLSMEADWISVATVPMLTMFTCAGEGTGLKKLASCISQVYLFITFTYLYNLILLTNALLGEDHETLKQNKGETLFAMLD